MKKSMLLVLGIAMTALLASGPAAASAVEEDVVYEDTPYIDALGNFDAKLAKEYADLVDSYTDADGIKWEVWLDEFGGQMWEEAVDGAGTLDFPIYHLFVPDYVKVWKSGGGYGYYTVAGTDDGFIDYVSTISCTGMDVCYKWVVWAVNDEPKQATEIEGRGKSTNDYCDGNYDGFFALPDGPWSDPNYTPSCYYTGGVYLYWVHDDEDFSGTEDYDVGDKMIRWDYTVGAQSRSTRVYYAGVWPG